MEQAALTDLSSHFAFGDNWRNFLSKVDKRALDHAQQSMRNLVHPDQMKGAAFLDIGCGSGLSSLTAMRLGAEHITAIDIDPDSVAATKELFRCYAPDASIDSRVESIFDVSPKSLGRFDIVYSWGVLHHTGNMWMAIEKAAGLVKPRGLFVIAIYTKTNLCRLWSAEKRFYSSSPKWVQLGIRSAYKFARYVKMLAAGRNPISYVRSYSCRGMNFHNDVHDWLGGYPYESATADEVLARVLPLGFKAILVPTTPITRGWSGSGCAEYVFERIDQGGARPM